MELDIGSHEAYALVPPPLFVSAMSRHWTNNLTMPSSPALSSLWETMAVTFNRAITEASIGHKAQWKVLQPPTGSGKTEGACLYAALQAERNEALKGLARPVGVLIVTRLIDQANAIASRVNELCGLTVACARHSESTATADEAYASDVLVVTHKAFVDAAGNIGSASWQKLTEWRGGARLLTVIDEALANVVEESRVTLQGLGFALGCVPLNVAEDFPGQMKALKDLMSALQHQAADAQNDDGVALSLLWTEGSKWENAEVNTDMHHLRAAMRATPYDRVTIGQENGSHRKRIAERVDRTLEGAQSVLERWAFYARSGAEHSVNSAALLVPDSVPGAVVLDATAKQNFLWELLPNRAEIVPVRSGARTYRTVNLHIARARGIGKASMEKNFAKRYARLLEALEERLGTDRSVFLCTHKVNEHVPKTFQHRFARLEVGHWGAIDGRNDWKDFDTAVLFGLPFLDRDVWATGMFFALQGVQDEAWLEAPSWQGHSNVRTVMHQRQMSVSIIQAINRIRCRKVIDEGGGCAACDIFIILPADRVGDAILDDIQADMPDINVVPWDFDLDGPQVRKPRTRSSHGALITLMQNRAPGEVSMSLVQRELGLKPKGLEKLRGVLRDCGHPTTRALAQMGVKLVTQGRTRGAKTFLVKHEAA